MLGLDSSHPDAKKLLKEKISGLWGRERPGSGCQEGGIGKRRQKGEKVPTRMGSHTRTLAPSSSHSSTLRLTITHHHTYIRTYTLTPFSHSLSHPRSHPPVRAALCWEAGTPFTPRGRSFTMLSQCSRGMRVAVTAEASPCAVLSCPVVSTGPGWPPALGAERGSRTQGAPRLSFPGA